tara:strand:+ start:116 stop:379 length:264 start_codon:yes stop_codon:yes gene_type:complete
MNQKQIEKEINQIKKRNKRVESDKAWETSIFRRIIITLMTYIIIVLFLWIINIPNYWLNALIPTAGFILSTLSLPILKKWWIKNKHN